TLLLFLSLLLIASMMVLVRRIDPSSKYSKASPTNVSPAKSALVNYHAFAESQGLTPRQTEVLGYLAIGRSNAYIAKQLNISENTAKAHVGKIYERLNVHCRDELLDLLEHYDATNPTD
ncbi:MAG: helix-turn-helix transcriptional regulator, partial [Raoultibacter sp.]